MQGTYYRCEGPTYDSHSLRDTARSRCFTLAVVCGFLALWLSAQPARCEASPYPLETVREFYCAVERGDHDAVLDLRSERELWPANAFVTLLNGHRTIDSSSLIIEPVRDEPYEKEYRVLLAVHRQTPAKDAASLIAFKERVIRLASERGRWKVTHECSVERSEVEDVVSQREPLAALERLPVAALSDEFRFELFLYCYERMSLADWPAADVGIALMEKLARILGDERSIDYVKLLRVRKALFQGVSDAASLEQLLKVRADLDRIGERELSAQVLIEIAGFHIVRLSVEQARREIDGVVAEASATENEYLLASALRLRARVLGILGDYDEIEKSATQALSIARHLGAYLIEAQTLYILGTSYGDHDRTAAALNCDSLTTRLAHRIGDWWLEAGALMNVGERYIAVGDPALALAPLREAFEVFCQVHDERDMAQTLAITSTAFDDLGLRDEALRASNEALLLSNNLTAVAYRIPVLRAVAAHFRTTRRFEDAQRYDLERLSLCTFEGDPLCDADALNSMALTSLQSGNYAMAVDCAERASQTAALGDAPSIRAMAEQTKGIAFTKMGALAKAERAYKRGIAAFEETRTRSVGGLHFQSQFMDRNESLFRGLSALLASQGRTFEALSVAETGKARGLVDVLREGRERPSKNLPAVLKAEEQQWIRELVRANRNLAAARSSGDAGRISALRAEAERQRRAYEDLETRIYASYPEIKVDRGAMSPITKQRIRSLLRDDTAVLEYVVPADGVASLLIVTKKQGRLSVSRVPLSADRGELERQIRAFVLAVRSRDFNVREPSRKLYKTLLARAEPLLDGKTRWIVVPDGPIWDVPFEALTNPAGRYVIERASLSYAPSLTAYSEMVRRSARKPSHARPVLLAFGNPLTRPTTRNASRGPSWSSLPEAEDEVRGIANVYGDAGKLRIRRAASVEAFKQLARDADVIHLATHASADKADPMYSYLVFASEGQSDGRLEAWQIADLDLRARMVVLSACETGSGKTLGGEGVIGLAWAWMVAGTPTTVVSRWEVNSASTTRLMVQFHQRLTTSTSRSIAESLRQASLTLLEDPQYRHPFYWAAFQVIGSDSAGAGR